MAKLSIRKLEGETDALLRARAARHGISRQEEVQQNLKQSVAPLERMGDLFLKVFGPNNGADLEIPSREPHEPIGFES